MIPQNYFQSETLEKPLVTLINMVVYHTACRLEGALAFQLTLYNPSKLFSRAISVKPLNLNLSFISSDYHTFAKMFSKYYQKQLSNHCPYDLNIQIKEDKLSFHKLIYSFSILELQMLREFLKENLKTDIIQLFHSLCGSSVLFMKKKNGSLQLCIDYQKLNRITRKDHYPIPLVSDLLETPKKI